MSLQPIRLPTVFRRRITIAFIAVAGLSAGLLAAGSYFVVMTQREEAFVDRSKDQARVVLQLTSGKESADQLDALVEIARERTEFETVVISDGVLSSQPDFDIALIPTELRDVPEGKLESAEAHLNNRPFLVVAGAVSDSGSDAQIYLFFARTSLEEGLNELRNVLIAGWVIISLVAALVARYVARRTLIPIRRAAETARASVEQLLDTDLPDRSGDEFNAWARSFNDLALALQAKITELSAAHDRERRFTADVAHDLRTPVGAMVTAASLLEETIDGLPEESRRPAELLVADTKRLRHLVNDLLEIGRLDAKQDPPMLEPIDLRRFLNGIVQSARGNTPVTVDVPEIRITSDRRRMERVVYNLISNAVQHGGNGVGVSARVAGEELRLEVVDRGPGIPEGQLAHVFDRFHKVSSSRSGQGSGLGLAIALQHAGALGGDLTAANRSGGGARFAFVVPLNK